MNVIVVGGGKVGAHLAELLLTGGHQVQVIEVRSEKMAALLMCSAAKASEGRGGRENQPMSPPPTGRIVPVM